MLRIIKVLTAKERVRPKFKRPYTGIYQIRCLANRKRFIASASDCDKRLRNHLTILRKGKHRNKSLQIDFNEYGEKRFEFKVLHKFKTKDLKGKTITEKYCLIKDLTKYWIDKFQTTDQKNGYNNIPD